MAIQKLNFPTKVTNGGATPSGILTSAEFNRIPSKIDEIIDALGQKHPVTWSDILSKPTTIGGFGITDAKIANGIITLGSNSITPLTSDSTLDATKLTKAVPLGSIPKLTFDKLPDMYWASLKVSDAADFDTNPTFFGLNIHDIEFRGGEGYGGYMDFHYGKSTDDYTTRIAEFGDGLTIAFGANAPKKQLFIEGDDSQLRIGNFILKATSNGLLLSQANGAAANMIATAFYESSDRRLKKDVKEIDDLEIADKIKFREFRFLSNDERLRYGVIAQELEAVGLHQLVSDGDYKSVNYISMLCLKMAAMEKKITSLTQEIERLKHE